MKMTETSVAGGRVEFLGSADYKAINHKFTTDTKSGALVEITDGTGVKLKGINLYDVTVANNPNGAVVVEGIIITSKLPVAPVKGDSGDKMFPTLIFK